MSDRAVIYLRVSSDDQCVVNQLLSLEEWAARNTLRIVRVYREEVSAWKNGHQVELNRLLSDTLYGKFDYLIVWALDRLTREGVAKLMALINTLGQRGS